MNGKTKRQASKTARGLASKSSQKRSFHKARTKKDKLCFQKRLWGRDRGGIQ